MGSTRRLMRSISSSFPDESPQRIEQFVRRGGRVLVAGTTPPPLPIGTVVGRRTTQGYWRIRDRDAFPSLRDTDLIFLDGDYVELSPIARPLLTLIPAAMFGPPEKVWSDKVETRGARRWCFADHEQGASWRMCHGMSVRSTTGTARLAMPD